MPSTKKISAERFVELWQGSPSLEAAAKKTGLTKRQASLRAYHLRNRGVPLKVFQEARTGADVQELTKIAEAAETKEK